MKKGHFYRSNEAFRHLSLACAFRRAAETAKAFESNPWLIVHFKACMRMYAQDAVRCAKQEAAR